MPKRGVIGDDNIVGQRVVALRKEQKLKQKDLLARLQVRGLNLNQSSLSALEGQRRRVSDRELVVRPGGGDGGPGAEARRDGLNHAARLEALPDGRFSFSQRLGRNIFSETDFRRVSEHNMVKYGYQTACTEGRRSHAFFTEKGAL